MTKENSFLLSKLSTFQPRTFSKTKNRKTKFKIPKSSSNVESL
jgi:hypothetical protein